MSATYDTIDYASNLVRSSTLDPDEQNILDRELASEIEEEQVQMMIDYLHMNQLDLVTERGYLSPKAIVKHSEKFEA